MTPGEIALMRSVLREEIDSALVPVRSDVAKLAARTDALEQAKKTHSGQFRAVTKEVIPQLRSSAEEMRKGDMGAIAHAFDQIVHLANDMNERGARTEDTLALVVADVGEIKSRGLVKVTDDRGAISIKPAMIVNTEATLRTEGKADAIQVAANRSDTQSLVAARWSKLGPLITSIVFAALVGLWQFIQYLIHVAASP